MGKIKVAVAGVGNCCSALVQGVQEYSMGSEIAQRWFYEFVLWEQQRRLLRLNYGGREHA